MDDCTFCKIASGEYSSYRIHEDADLIAFLDKGPIRPGHVQIIPHIHHPYFDDLPVELAGRIVALGQTIAKAMKKLYEVPRVGFVFTGNDIAHVHAHLIPLHLSTDVTSRQYITDRDLTFASPPCPAPAEMEATRSALEAALHA